MRLWPLVLLVAAPLAAAPAASDPRAGNGANADREAPFDFVLGKMAALEGAPGDAAAAFERALKLAPQDPYLRLEYATFLLRRAQYAGDKRADLLRQAAEQASAAAASAPHDVDVLRIFGQAEFALGEHDESAMGEARRAFEGVIAERPEDLPSLSALGQIYLALGEAGKAADVLSVAAHLRPDSSALSSMLLEALLKAERREDASKMLRARLDEDPSDLQSRLALADLLSDGDDHRGAVDLLRSAVPEQRDSSDVRRRLAIEEYRIGDMEAALADLAPLLQAEPGYTGGRYLRGLIYSALARNADAEKDFAALLQEAPENADFALNLARVLEREGRRPEAISFLQETLSRVQSAASKDPKASSEEAAGRLRIALSLAATRTKQWSQVETVLGPLLDAKGHNEWADEAILIAVDARVEAKRGDDALALLVGREDIAFVAKRCEVLQKLQRSREAADCFTHLEGLPGEDGLVQAADARQRLEDFAASIPLLERARQRVPESTEVQYRLASAYERTGQRGPALDLLRGILDHQPDYAPALNYLGYMLAEKGENLQEALGLAERAVRLDPGNGAYVDSLGWAHFRLGQLPEARTYLERAVGLIPDDATICEHLGDVYVATGETQKARVTYRQALDLGGENAAAVERKLHSLPGGS